MLFFGGTNGLTKGSSIAVVWRVGLRLWVTVMVPVLAGEHAHNKHVGEDRNEDFGEGFGEDSVRRSGRAIVEL